MGRAKNSLTRESISSTPLKFRYAVTYESSSLGSYGITTGSGINWNYAVNMSPQRMEEMNVYRLVRQLYYQVSITGSMGTASFYDPMWQSTAASGSGVETVYQFPTQTGSIVTVFCIPSSQFGENVSRNSFILSSSAYYIADDGNGNIIDYKNSNTHVGNIFYSQGIAVVTNVSYSSDLNNYLDTQNYFDIQTQNNDDILI